MNSKYLSSALLAMSLALVSAGSNAAALYNFEGSDNDGTGKASMSFAVSSNILTVTLNNISPTRLDSAPTVGNVPGISGFGFNLLDPDTLALQSWSFKAWNETNTIFITIGSNTQPSLDWAMGTTLTNITVDYLPNNGGIADGMLFNPAILIDPVAEALLPNGQNDVFFTTAILTMTFAEGQTPSLNDTAEWSPFVRMQRVGLRGEGSLKLPGILDNDNDNDNDNGGGGGQAVPEPSLVGLLGIGLLGMAASRKKSMGA